MNSLISFSESDFVNLEHLKELSNDINKQKEIDELIAKIKAIIESEGYAHPVPKRKLDAIEILSSYSKK